MINGKETMFFNILPLKYQWAYDLYKTMKNNHWEPEDITMQKDVEQWRSDEISDVERWIIKMGIGYFSAAEGIVGDNVLHVVREVVTAPELKLVLGRHAHEENIHADCARLHDFLPRHQSRTSARRCSRTSRRSPRKTTSSSPTARPSAATSTSPITENKQALAKNIFMFGQVMEGTQFYGLFGMILSLYRQNKFPGIGQMFRYTLRDESNHIEVFRNLLMDLIDENPDIWTEDFREDLRATMKEGITLEKSFIRDCLPVAGLGLNSADFEQYIDYIADRRLTSCGLAPLNESVSNPFPWLAEMMDIKKETNFFEGRVTEYQKASALASVDDDEL